MFFVNATFSLHSPEWEQFEEPNLTLFVQGSEISSVHHLRAHNNKIHFKVYNGDEYNYSD